MVWNEAIVAQKLAQRKIVVKQVLLSSREHRLKIGLDQDAGDRFPLVPLNLDLAVLHRAAGPAGALHRFSRLLLLQ